jgi:hypothetical protein
LQVIQGRTGLPLLLENLALAAAGIGGVLADFIHVQIIIAKAKKNMIKITISQEVEILNILFYE